MTGKTVIATAVTFLCAVIIIALFNAVRINSLSFGSGAKRLLEKSEMVSKKAHTFKEKEALKNLGMNSINRFYYRFDDHVEEAMYKSRNFDSDKSHTALNSHGFEFNSYEDLNFEPAKGTFTLESGILKLKYSVDDYLHNSKDLNVVKESIAEIELRMKVKQGRKMKFGWGEESDAQWMEWLKSFTIDTIPDNTFHVYRINAKNILRTPLPGEYIQKIFLRPSNVDNDAVEIDYIRFILKREKYHKELCSETYETINEEKRKVLYSNTPLYVTYSITIPEGKAFLKFGMGILEEDDPVTFRLVVKDDNMDEEVFFKKITNTSEWQDAIIDFSEWSGRRVEISFATESEKGNIAFWSNPTLYSPPKERFNVIILLEDTLRADHMSCYGYFRETTPVKDIFIKKGVIFLNAFSQATKTRPSCPSIMTSLYPTATGVWSPYEMLDDRYLTLAEIMRNQGFATASFIQNGNAGPAAGLHQGFSTLFDTATMGQRAEAMYSEKLYTWIKENSDRNFFLYLHLVDPHGPYDPPPPFDSWYREALSGKTPVEKNNWSDPEWVETPTLEGRRLLYDGEIRYNDFCFERFLQKLEEYKLLNDTLIVVIADHGEHLGEHGLWEHSPPGYTQVLHVPLLMVYPKKLPKKMEIAQPVQLIDVMPTILDLADIKKDTFLIEGDSLVSLMHGEKADFWNSRLSVSEEVVYKDKEDESEWASIVYKNWHIMNSNELSDGLSSVTKYFGKKISGILFGMRVFNYYRDKEEEHYINSFLFDIVFKYKVKRVIRKLQSNNMALWKALTRETKKMIKYNPEELERLRALGYLRE